MKRTSSHISEATSSCSQFSIADFLKEHVSQLNMQHLFRFVLHSSPSSTSTATTEVTNKVQHTPRTDKRKAVSFFGRVLVFEYLSRNELSEDEHCYCWYSQTELNQIHQENDETVIHMMNGTFPGQKWCARGLEGRTPAGARLRSKNRRESIDAVIRYQSLERESGVTSSEEKIAKLYSECTEHSARIARLMASIDAQSVEGEDTLPSLPTNSTPKRCMRRLSSPSSIPSPIVVSVG